MYSGNYTLRVSQGDSFSIGVIAKNDDGSRFSLVGWTGVCGIKCNYCSTGYLATIDVNITNPASGEVTLSMAATGTALLPTTIALYDLEFGSGDYRKKFLRGDVYIYPEITNSF